MDWLNKYSQEKTALVAENYELKRKIAELEQKLSGAGIQIPLKTQIQTQTKLSTKSITERPIQYPEDCWEYYNRGEDYRNLKQYKQAIEYFSKAIQLNPDPPKFYLSRGRCYQALGNISKANSDFEKYKKLS